MSGTRQNLDVIGQRAKAVCRLWAMRALVSACLLLVGCQPSQPVSTIDIATRRENRRHHHQYRGGSGGPCRRRP